MHFGRDVFSGSFGDDTPIQWPLVDVILFVVARSCHAVAGQSTNCGGGGRGGGGGGGCRGGGGRRRGGVQGGGTPFQGVVVVVCVVVRRGGVYVGGIQFHF